MGSWSRIRDQDFGFSWVVIDNVFILMEKCAGGDRERKGEEGEEEELFWGGRRWTAREIWEDLDS